MLQAIYKRISKKVLSEIIEMFLAIDINGSESVITPPLTFQSLQYTRLADLRKPEIASQSHKKLPRKMPLKGGECYVI